MSAAWLAATRRLPRTLVAFLEDCRRAGLLREVGPRYEFRHAMFQDYLATAAQSRRREARTRRGKTRPALEQAVALIAHDLAATLDWDPRRATTFAEEVVSVSVDGWDAARGNYAIKLAEDVQQRLHDTFVHTTWPACPLHPQHPLWLDGEHDRAVWRCPQAGIDIAPLGSLTGST